MRKKTSGSSCATIGSPTASSSPTTTSSTMPAKPGTSSSRASPLDDQAEWLLALVAHQSDLTLAEIEARLLAKRQFKTMDSSIARFGPRNGVPPADSLSSRLRNPKLWPIRVMSKWGGFVRSRGAPGAVRYFQNLLIPDQSCPAPNML
jgi:hypothetical protein